MNKSAIGLIWLVLVSSLAFILNLGSVGLVDETEPLFAEAARQMVVTGDWITPYFNGETRFDKPPLIYWMMAIFYKILGVNEWAVRLPSAFSAIALMVGCFYTLRYFCFNPHNNKQPNLWIGAILGAGIVAFNMQVLIWARTGVSDMLLTGCIGLALLCFFWGYSQGKNDIHPSPSVYSFPKGYYLAFYILLALAVLTKGPVGIVLPGLIILAFTIYLGNFKQVLQEIGVIWGGIIFLALTLPWYILVTLQNGEEYINGFFGYHNIERFTNVVNNHSAPWYFYFIIVLGLFAPWSIYLPLAMARIKFWQRKFWQKQPRHQQLGLFAFFWFITIFIFFTIAVTKLPSYVLPLIPAATILVSLLWSEEFSPLDRKNNSGLFINAIINIILLIILAIGFILIRYLIGQDPAIVDLPSLIENSGLPLRGAMIWAITAIIIVLLITKRKYWRYIILANLIGFICFFLFGLTPGLFLLDEARQLPLRQLSEIVIQQRLPEEELIMIGFSKPTVAFYTREKVNFFQTNQGAVNYVKDNLNKFPDTVLILTRPQDITKINLQLDKFQIIGSKGVYQLLRVIKADMIS